MNIVKRSGVYFYHKLKLKHLSNHTFSHNSNKSKARISQISQFFGFDSGSRESGRSLNVVNNVIQASLSITLSVVPLSVVTTLTVVGFSAEQKTTLRVIVYEKKAV